MFGPIRFNMAKLDSPMPSAGSVIDAIGLSYANLDDRMKALDGSGAKILQAPRMVPKFFRTAVIEDPWGTRIELVQDPQLLGFHHVRLRASTGSRGHVLAMVRGEAWRRARQGWRRRRADVPGGIWLIVDKAETQPTASAGTTIDHLGFRTKDINAEVADLKAKGVTVTGPPRQDPNVATTFATFIQGATGRIELTERYHPI